MFRIVIYVRVTWSSISDEVSALVLIRKRNFIVKNLRYFVAEENASSNVKKPLYLNSQKGINSDVLAQFPLGK